MSAPRKQRLCLLFSLPYHQRLGQGPAKSKHVNRLWQDYQGKGKGRTCRIVPEHGKLQRKQGWRLKMHNVKGLKARKQSLWTLSCRQLEVIQCFEQTVIHSNIYSAQVQFTLLGTMQSAKANSTCSLLHCLGLIAVGSKKVLGKLFWQPYVGWIGRRDSKARKGNNRQSRASGQSEIQ